MYDPMTVAFEIKRPWPTRNRLWKGHWYWPPLITIWHVDPETNGYDDDSCDWFRRKRTRENGWYPATIDAYERLSPEAREAVDFLTWTFRKQIQPWRLPVRWHVHHWQIQIHPWQQFKRWAFSRCAKCGGRFRWNESVVGFHWDPPKPRHWWTGERDIAHMACAGCGLARSADAVARTDGRVAG
jgi:hypothetical protein